MTQNEIIQIRKEWIRWAKLYKKEFPDVTVTKEQYEWFGWAMGNINGAYDFDSALPAGTECRKYPRSFFRILEGGAPFVISFLMDWAKLDRGHFEMACICGTDAIYELIGYNITSILTK